MLIIWKGISYVLLGLGTISFLLMLLAIVHPKLTFRFWKLQTRKPLVSLYLVLFLVMAGLGSGAREASLTPEEKAQVEAESEAWHAERERRATEKKATEIKDLLAEVRAIPSSNLKENLDGYKRLVKLDPDNREFEVKAIHYQQLVDEVNAEAARLAEATRQEQARAAAAANAVLTQRESRHGEKPLQGGWDNGVPIVKRYIESIANDPDSIKYENWWPVMYSEKDGWFVKCDWRAKNGFGVYVRSVDVFYIRFGRVAETRK